MSLDGNLRVFSLTEVFQMLGMQRKSGILTVEGPKDTISVGFVTGRIVFVESSSNRIENRLGTLLVKAGRLTEDELAGALELQKKKQGRLGRLLLSEEIVRAEDLREAIRIQVQRILFGAFGWTDGRFRFAPQAVIEHDPEIFQPMPTESILLEAARHFDELPLAEQKIPSNELVFRRAPSAHTRQLVAESSSDQEGALAVSKREAETWKWIDGRRTVAEIRERAFLSDLDVLKGISDLLDRGLIEEGYVRETPSAVEPSRRRAVSVTAILPWIPVIAAAAIAMSFAPRNPANLFLRPVSEIRQARDLLKANSLARLLTVGRAVRMYYGATGRYPRTLGQLVAEGILDEEALQDPYGRFYRYILRPEDGKFALNGRSAKGQIDLDLAHEGQLAPVTEVHPSGTPPASLPERPAGVQVVN
ncbi:MAG TPA: DUF4388 domain-containing protein [Thermoanaerobaculia bacterium]|nr:DUF4388 domain-containing protein [Thermoanaerobaculia bacterium]